MCDTSGDGNRMTLVQNTSLLPCHLQTSTVWPLSPRCILSDTCNNSVNRMKIELTLKTDFTPLEGWKLWMSPVASGSSESLFCSLRCVIREEVRHRLQSSISHWRKWYVHHCLCPTSSVLSASMHITCVKAARDKTRETESHHTAATQGGVFAHSSQIQPPWGLFSDLQDVVEAIYCIFSNPKSLFSYRLNNTKGQLLSPIDSIEHTQEVDATFDIEVFWGRKDRVITHSYKSTWLLWGMVKKKSSLVIFS